MSFVNLLQTIKRVLFDRVTGFFSKLFVRYPKRARSLYKLVFKKYTLNHAKSSKYTLGFNFEYSTSLVTYNAGVDFTWQLTKEYFQNDDEKLYSLHRWYWLFTYLNQKNSVQVIQTIKHWIACNPYEQNCSQWETYSASERVHSFLMYLALTKSSDETKELSQEDKDINEFLRTSMFHIANRLEYFLGKYTFNHVVNDVKGIAMIAIALGDREVINSSIQLLKKELDIITDSNGFCREGSSHYQFIVARWIVDTEYLMRYFSVDSSLIDSISMIRSNLMPPLSFFTIHLEHNKYCIPLFGDVSPDFSPDWILKYFYGYHSNESNVNTIAYKSQIANIGSIFNDDRIVKFNDYSRYNYCDWVLIIRHPKFTGDHFLSHSHSDFLSYCLFYKGVEIIGDRGRKDYTLPFTSDEYCSPSAHNVSTINNFPLALGEHFYYLPSSFCKSDHEVKMLDDKDLVIDFILNSIPHLPTLRSKKRFTINENSFSVEEFFEIPSPNNYMLKSGVNFSSSMKYDERGIIKLIDESGLIMNFEPHCSTEFEFEILNVMYSPAYGIETPINRVEMSAYLSGNITIGYKLNLE